MLRDGIIKAFELLFSFDADLYRVIFLSLGVSAAATALSFVTGIAAALFLTFNNFPLKKFVVTLVNMGMGLPPVVVGLFITMLLWRGGIFGNSELLYTPYAMIIAQFCIAFPMVAGVSYSAFISVPQDFIEQMKALGADRKQLMWLVVRETRVFVLSAVMAGFGSVISEVGASMMVGGNIKGDTRVLTTATVLETSMGNFDRAIALSLILLIIVYLVNFLMTHYQAKRGQRS